MNRLKVATIALMSFLTVYAGVADNQQANAQTRRRVDLTGQWRVTSPAFHSIIPIERGCHSGPLPGTGKAGTAVAKLNIIERPNKSVFVPPFRQWVNVAQKRSGYGAVKNAKVSGNVFSFTETGGGFTSNFKGTVSPDGNKITGKVLCKHTSGKDTASGPFTLVRLTKPRPPIIQGNG